MIDRLRRVLVMLYWRFLVLPRWRPVSLGDQIEYTWEDAGRRVLEDLDLSVINDFYCSLDCAKCKVDEEHMGEPCHYIGWPEELDAGIRGGSAETPMFNTVKEAFKWAGHNEEALRKQFPVEVPG